MTWLRARLEALQRWWHAPVLDRLATLESSLAEVTARPRLDGRVDALEHDHRVTVETQAHLQVIVEGFARQLDAAAPTLRLVAPLFAAVEALTRALTEQTAQVAGLHAEIVHVNQLLRALPPPQDLSPLTDRLTTLEQAHQYTETNLGRLSARHDATLERLVTRIDAHRDHILWLKETLDQFLAREPMAPSTAPVIRELPAISGGANDPTGAITITPSRGRWHRR